ncbi:MAG: glycosyltransferase [Alphaproteobacteria bacterium]
MNAPISPPLSIIIPALNEAPGIERLLNSLSPMRARGVEIIVVDGASEDGTFEIARPLIDQIATAPRGRAVECGRGTGARRDASLSPCR